MPGIHLLGLNPPPRLLLSFDAFKIDLLEEVEAKFGGRFSFR